MFGIPIPFTVLKGHDYVEDLLERDELVNVQLPQKFDRAKLVAAHEAARRDGTSFTEDASLFHRYAGERVRILPGSERNIKITVPTDVGHRRGDLRRRHRSRRLTMGKVCVITGASQGIGRAAAIRMSREPESRRSCSSRATPAGSRRRPRRWTRSTPRSSASPTT